NSDKNAKTEESENLAQGLERQEVLTEEQEASDNETSEDDSTLEALDSDIESLSENDNHHVDPSRAHLLMKDFNSNSKRPRVSDTDPNAISEPFFGNENDVDKTFEYGGLKRRPR